MQRAGGQLGRGAVDAAVDLNAGVAAGTTPRESQPRTHSVSVDQVNDVSKLPEGALVQGDVSSG